MTEEEAVLACDDARLEATLAADIATLERLTDPQLVFVHANGRQDGKAAFLAAARDGRIVYRSISREETNVTVTDGIAIVCSATRVEVTVAGVPRSSPVRYMGVWTKRSGQWTLLAIDMVRPAE